MEPRLSLRNALLLTALLALQAAVGCSGNQMADEDMIPDAITDQSENQGSGENGDSFAGGDEFGEDAPVPAPESLPVPEGQLAQAETVDAMARKVEAGEGGASPAFAEAAPERGLSQVPAPVAATRASVRKVRRRARLQPVVVRTRPFQSNGSLLNSFYFTRAEDASWVDLAQKIYGDPSRSEDLKIWNGGSRLATGTLIYYSSPVRPNDTEQMKSLAQDSGTGTEGYAIQRGDTLSRIASSRYGGPQSWKEIAAENPEIKNPDWIDPGMRIQLPPVRLESRKVVVKLPDPIPAPVAALPAAPAAPAAVVAGAVAEAVSADGIRLSPQVLAGAVVVLLIGSLLLRRRAV